MTAKTTRPYAEVLARITALSAVPGAGARSREITALADGALTLEEAKARLARPQGLDPEVVMRKHLGLNLK